jgi:hypothetical protein
VVFLFSHFIHSFLPNYNRPEKSSLFPKSKKSRHFYGASLPEQAGIPAFCIYLRYSFFRPAAGKFVHCHAADRNLNNDRNSAKRQIPTFHIYKSADEQHNQTI